VTIRVPLPAPGRQNLVASEVAMRRHVSMRTSQLFTALFVLTSAATLLAQQSGPKNAANFAQSSSQKTEVAAGEANPAFNFQTERNLVIVRAVVLDSGGHAVANLKKDDFRLYDDGKLQRILQFSRESAGEEGSPQTNAALQSSSGEQPESGLAPAVARRFLGLYFDDVHMQNTDVMRIKAAARKYLAEASEPGDRVGVFTSSGQGDLDFTLNRAALDQAISRLGSRPGDSSETNPCPRIYPYQAFQIVDERNESEIQEAVLEAVHCRFQGDTQFMQEAQTLAEAEAYRVLQRWQRSSQDVLRELDHLIRRMAVLPGQRNIVLISPGFLTLTKEFDIDQIVDHALRSNVAIGALDSRGLAVESPFDGIQAQAIILPERPDLMGQKAMSKVDEFQQDSGVLRTIAEDTGGYYFGNDNNLVEGFRKTASLAPVYYVLAFSPRSIEENGRFHHLMVKLTDSKGLIIEARRGYFAPRKSAGAAEQAQHEIQQAVFSQNQVLQLPIDVHTQFFMTDQHDARLAVLTHLDLRPLPFHKKQGRNLDKLTFVTALFDRDGHYVTGKETHVDFHLLDVSLQELMSSGLTVKNSFNVKPGVYLIRQVVRDGQGGQISGINRTVEIPN
jgi:VWFA-related protein